MSNLLEMLYSPACTGVDIAKNFFCKKMWEVVSPRRYMFGKYFTCAILNDCFVSSTRRSRKLLLRLTTTDNKLQQQK